MLHLQEFLHGHCYSDQTEEDPPFNVALSVSGMAGGEKAFLDHQDNAHRVFSKRLLRSSLFTLEDEDGMDVSEDTGDVEQRQRLEEPTHNGSDEFQIAETGFDCQWNR